MYDVTLPLRWEIINCHQFFNTFLSIRFLNSVSCYRLYMWHTLHCICTTISHILVESLGLLVWIFGSSYSNFWILIENYWSVSPYVTYCHLRASAMEFQFMCLNVFTCTLTFVPDRFMAIFFAIPGLWSIKNHWKPITYILYLSPLNFSTIRSI